MLGVALPLAAPAQTSPLPIAPIVIVSNFDQTVDDTQSRVLDADAPKLVQKFETGTDRGKFVLTGFQIKVAEVVQGAGFNVTAHLHRANAMGQLGGSIVKLERPSSSSTIVVDNTSVWVWEVPYYGGIELEPDTPYWLVLSCNRGVGDTENCNGTEAISFAAVPGNDEDDQGTRPDGHLFDDWTINNGSLSGGTYSPNSLAIRLMGNSARIPYLVDGGVQIASTPLEGSTYGLGETIVFTVGFSRLVTVDTGPYELDSLGGITNTPVYPDIPPTFRFKLGDSGMDEDFRHARFAGGNYERTLRFAYTVAYGDIDTDGIFVGDHSDSLGHNLPGAIKGATTLQRAILDFDAPGTRQNHKVDASPRIDSSNPVRITSVPLGTQTYGEGEVIEVTVTFDQPVRVTGNDVSAELEIGESGAKERYAAYRSGSGTTELTFGYTVASTDRDSDGVELPADLLKNPVTSATWGTDDIVALVGDVGINLDSAGVPDDPDHKVDGGTVNAAVAVSHSALEVVEGDATGSQYSVWLTSAPQGTATVTVSADPSSSSDVTFSPASLTFTTSSFAERQFVTVKAADDDDVLNDDTATLKHAVTGFGAVTTARDVAVTVMDDDTVDLTVDPTALTIREGDTAGYTVNLTAEPSDDVTVLVTGASGDLSIDQADPVDGTRVLTFTADNWNVAQTVTLRLSHDDDAADDPAVTLKNALSSGGLETVTLTLEEDDSEGVTVDPTVLRLIEGDTAAYTVVLTAEPTQQDVTVTVSSDASSSSDVTFSPESLTFTSGDWDTPRTVTVTAMEDTDDVNDAATLSHLVSGDFAGVSADSVDVTVEDNDRGATVRPLGITVIEEDATGSSYTVALHAAPANDVTVTISADPAMSELTIAPESLMFTTGDWDTAQTVTVTAAMDVDASDEQTTLKHAVSGADIVVPSVGVTVMDDDRWLMVDPNGVTVPEGDTAGSTYTVVLGGRPSAPVTVAVGGHVSTDLTVVPEKLTFTTGNWSTKQTVTVTAAEDVDAVHDEETLVHTPSGGGFGDARVLNVIRNEVDGVNVTVDDKHATARVNPTRLTVMAGSLAGSSYTVVLNGQPSDPVTVTVDVPTNSDLTVAPVKLTFTNLDYSTAQTVTVTAAVDDDAANDVELLVHRVRGSQFGGAPKVEVTVEDADGVTVSDPELTVEEADATGSSYTVALAGQPLETTTVTVSRAPDSSTDVTFSPESLTFSTINWRIGQTVMVVAAKDADAVNDSATLKHAVSRDGNDLGDASAVVAVTVNDIDTAGVSVDPTELTVEEADATGASYTVVLDTEPTGDVTVTVGGHAGTDLTVLPASLTFTTGDWDDAQTVTVTAAHDADAVNDVETLTHAVSGGGYDEVDAASVAVTVLDDERGVAVSKTELTVEEEDATGASYTVVLKAAPTGDVTVTVGGHSGTDLTVAPESLTFTTGDWDDAQTVTVTAAHDADAVNDTETLTHTVSGGGYDEVAAASVAVTVEDIDTAGVSVDPTDLKVEEEDTTGASYTVVLDTAPTGDVTVTVEGHSGTDLTVLPASLTFTTGDWDDAQTVTVTAAHDADAVNDVETLTHAVSGGGYDEVDAASVAVTVLDDERGVTVSKTELEVEEEDATGASYTVVLDTEPTGDVTVTVGGHSGTDLTVVPASLTFTTGDWDDAQTVTVTAAHDADAVNDTETLTHTVSGGGYDEVAAASVAVTVEDIDTAGVSVDPTDLEVVEEDATGASYTVVLDTEPTGDVTVTVGGHAGTDLTVLPARLTFTTGDWDDAQTVTVTAAHDADAVNDVETLTHAVSGGGYDEVDAASVAVTVLDDERGVTVSKTELEVEEEDATGASYTVVLKAAPTGDVTVTVGGHSGTDLTVAPESLTFTTGDWNTAQTVTVTAVHDADAVNDTETLTHTVSGGGYDEVAAASVAVTVEDIDTAGVSVDPTDLEVVEEDATGASYTVVLDTEPTGDVTVTVDGHTGTDLTVLPASLTFTTGDWDDAQTVTVTAAHDADAVNDVETLTHAVSGGGYDEVDAASVAVTVLDDERGVTVSKTELEVEEEDATGASYTVVLKAAPTGDVTVTVGGHSGTDLTVAPESLTFTTGDWNTAQTVTVTAVHDADAVNDTETLTHTVSGGGYDEVAAASVAVTVEDIDTAGVSVDPTDLKVEEEDTTGASYTVVLDTAPTGDVTVTVEGHSGTDLTVLPASLTFTTGDWDDAQTVTVTAAHDADAVNDVETLTHAVSGGGYDEVDAASVAVTVLDDERGVAVSKTELTVEEEDATGASYTVVLDTEPTGDVTVTVGGHSGTDLTVLPASLTFTTGDWDDAQTVTVTAAHDADAENDTETLTHTVSGGGYDEVAAASVAVTVEDIDTAGVSVDPTDLKVEEEDTTGASYTVVLNTAPTGDVTVTVEGHSGTDLTVLPASLTFTTGDWDTAQTVTVTAAHDADAVNDTETLTHTVSGGEYDDVVVAGVEVKVLDDERGVTVSEAKLEVEEEDATGASYTVVLKAAPAGDVTVTVGGHTGTDLEVLPASLTFTTGDWNTAQTVTVTAVHDADAVNDTETLTHTVSGGGYERVEAASVEVMVWDNERGVTVSEAKLEVEEEDATGASYTVVLKAAPVGDVTVTVGGHTGTDLTVAPESLTFTTDDWDDAQTVTVTAAHDADAENDTETLTHTVSGGGYDGVEAAGVSVTVEDNERGVTVSETELTVDEEGATGAGYTVVLDTAPTGDVTVTVGGHSGTDLTVAPESLTFTTGDWNTAQTVTVTAVHDADAVNDTETLTHTVSGGGYDEVAAASVAVTVEDNERGVTVSESALTVTEEDATGASYTVVLDTAPTGDVTVTVGGHTGTDLTVLPASLTFTTADWDDAQTVTVTAGDDADAENDTETLTHTVSGGGYDAVAAAGVSVTVEDNERGVSVDPTTLKVEEEDATGASYTVVLDTAPTGDVTVTVGGHTGTDLTVAPESLTFTTDDWDDAQTVTVTAAHDADAENDTETLTHTVSGGGYDAVAAASVAVTVEDNERGVTVSESALTVTEEDATGASYTVVLDTAPTGDVTVTVGGHTGTDLTVLPASLTFTTADWDDAQTVTVTAAHDADAENDTETLTHTVSGGGYDAVAAAGVSVTVEDNERGVSVDPTTLKVEEEDATGASYTVVLDTEPTGEVTVTVGGHSGTDLTVLPASLTFTTADWDDAQTVTVTAAHDADAENDTETLTHTVSGGGYGGVAAAGVSVTVEDNERGVTVSESALTVTEEDATGASYTVVLDTAPTGDVTVTVGGHSGTDLTVLPASLTFTTADWDDAQTVTVTAAHDADAENDTETLTHTVSGGGYDAVEAASVAVTVSDIDTAGVSVDPTELTVEEEDATGASYTVVLDTEPTGDVTVTVRGHTGTDLTVVPASLTFTTGDWNDAQTVTVTAAHDANAENDTETLTHTVSGGGYDDVEAASVAVTVEDNERGVTASVTELTVTEGDTTGSSYTVALSMEPSGPVTVTVGGHAGTDLTVDPARLTFTTADWDNAKTVTVTAAHDADAIDDTETLTHTATGGGYDAAEVVNIAVTVHDDELDIIRPTSPIWLCGARLDPPVFGTEAEIDICWNVGTAIPVDSDVTFELRSRFFWDYPTRFSKWSRVARGSDFTPCDDLTDSCVKLTHSFLYRGEPRTYELRMRRRGTVLATSPQLKAQAPNRNTNPFEPKLSRAPDPGSSCAVSRPSGPFVLKLTFAESYPEDYWNAWRKETVPCQGTDAKCLEPQDFDTINGTVTVNPWKGGSYKVTVTPTTLGQPVIVSLPANKVKGVGEGLEGNGTNQYTRDNVASNVFATNTTADIDYSGGSRLIAWFDTKPESHDGRTAFTVRIAFNRAVSTTAEAIRDDVVRVYGGAVTAVTNVDGRFETWELTIEPHSSSDVAVWVPASQDCLGSAAACTADGHPLSLALATVIPGPGAGTRTAPLTAQFSSVPAEHDGESTFTFALQFSEAIQTSAKTLRDHSIAVSGGRVERVDRTDGRRDLWSITVAPKSYADITLVLGAGRDCSETGAVCTAGGKKLSNAQAVVVHGPAVLSVADSRAREGENEFMVFDVVLNREAFSPVTVDYATRDGSATAGEDYTETSGTLTFSVGETVRGVMVPLLDDAKDEGEETFTLVLDNASGARIADGQAVGTIENHDPLQKEWIARFGRTVASQAVELIEDRLDGRDGDHISVGGIRINGKTPYTEYDNARPTHWTDELEPVRDEYTMTGRDLMLLSAFRLSSGGVDGAARWTAWGRFARNGFHANDSGLNLSGVVTTGMLGVDVSRDRWLAGLALGVSEGEGPFQLSTGLPSNRASGTVESVLTSAYPYARFGVTERLDVWGMAGVGSGEMTIAEVGGTPVVTDIDMSMYALGTRGALLEAGKRGSAFDLRGRADVLRVHMKSDAVHHGAGNLAAAKADVTRLRLILEGGRSFAIGSDGSLEPTVEAGVRLDDGDAETGTGFELGAGLRYTRPRLTIQGTVRKLLAHEESGYDEWGASGSLHIRPATSGRGLYLSLAPSWGVVSSGVERLRSAPYASVVSRDEEFNATSRLDTEVGYGFAVGDGLGIVVPYAGVRFGEADSRTLQVGTRWSLAPEANVELGVSRRTLAEREPDDAVSLNLRLRW